MINFEKAELLRIAKLSGMTLTDEELESVGNHLDLVISYTNELKKVDVESIIPAKGNVNVFRDDKAIPCENIEDILEDAPDKQDNHFVVPKIL